MNYLLDTHTFLWFINGDNALSLHAQSLIEDPSHKIFLSMASIWEMAIKISLGKLSVPTPFQKFLIEQIELNYFTILPIEVEHVNGVVTLPFHHRDPFDRLLIAQSIHEQLPIIGNDTVFDSYGISREW